MKSKIKAIYFDLDDTLCAYWAASRKGLRATFDEHGFNGETEKALEAWRSVFKTFSPEIKKSHWYERYLETGEPTRTEHMRRMLNEMGIPDDKQAAQLSERYAFFRDKNLCLFDEAPVVLSFLQGKYKLGLITNGPADIQRQEIATLGIEKFFDHILIEGEFKIGKPFPEIFDDARNKWGLQPDEMLFVGNAFEHDVQGAKNAGWHAIWVNKDGEINPGTEPQPDATITDLWDVVAWLGLAKPVAQHSARK